MMGEHMSSSQLPQRKMLGMSFQPGIRGVNVWVFFSTCWAGIMLAAFLPASQAYLFTEFLDIPTERHGTVGGSLAFWGEIAFLLVAGLWGAFSDRVGRRQIMAAGFALMAVSVYIYSIAHSLELLYAGRIIFALGSAAFSVMVVAIIADYASDRSRGKLTGWQGVFNGLGAMAAVFLFVKIPQMAMGRGADSVAAGEIMYLAVFAVAALIALVAWFGLSRVKTQDGESEGGHGLSIAATLREGARAAHHPRILLAYAAGFVSRGNLVIVGTFFILWLANYGSEIGMDRADAVARGGMIVGIAQGAALLAAPIFGILADRIDRVKALIIALTCSAAGYSGTILVTDPFGLEMILCAALIGVGEVAVIITSAVLIAQEAPVRVRGAVIGFFTLCGALGIMVAAKAGGWLFDHWNPAGPFVLFGVIAAIVCIWAVIQASLGRRAGQ